MVANKKTKILIIEKQLIIAANISVQLSKAGYHVIGIHDNTTEALYTIEQQSPDIIILDINIGGQENSISLAQHVLENSLIPIVFLTTQTNKETFEKAASTRPYALLSKPFSNKDLELILNFTLKRLEASKSDNIVNLPYARS